MKKSCLILTALAGILLSFISCKKDDTKAPKETVLYETDFSSDDGKWSLAGLPNVSVFINDGYFNIISDPSSNGIDTYLGNIFTPSQKNTAIEISLKVSRYNTSDNNAAGLIWGKSGSGATRIIHYFEISPLGGYIIYGYPDGLDKPYVDYVDWTTTSITEPGAFTRLRIELRDGRYHFLLNGTEVYSMQAEEGETLDVTGLATWGGVKVQVDYFKAVTLE